jgi:hypothetical protein
MEKEIQLDQDRWERERSRQDRWEQERRSQDLLQDDVHYLSRAQRRAAAAPDGGGGNRDSTCDVGISLGDSNEASDG